MVAIRVLLADPDVSLLTTYRGYLAGEGFEVATVTNGLDCLAQLRWFHPDVLILEPDLPWGWGDGVLARMQDHTDVPLVPVIVVSAGKRLANLSHGEPCPVRDFQLKPLAPYLLAQRIRQLVEQLPSPEGYMRKPLTQPITGIS